MQTENNNLKELKTEEEKRYSSSTLSIVKEI